MVIRVAHLSADEFESEYFRKRPILIKGGASSLLDFEIDVPTFRGICDRLERNNPGSVFREEGAIFAQNMDEGSERLRKISRAYEQELSAEKVWFDGVYAVDDRGIGCHYDHSDNFVLQQSGTKLWKLAPPSKTTSIEELRQRMLDAPNVGHTFMPDDCESFLVEAGDLLYIPLFWAHWGVSRGPSMSASLVLNVDNAADHLLRLSKKGITNAKSWWYPLPMVRRPATADAPIPPVVDEAFDQMLDAFSDESVRASLKRTWWAEGFAVSREDRERAEQAEAPRSIYDRPLDAIPLTSIGLPRDALEVAAQWDGHGVSPQSLLMPAEASAKVMEALGASMSGIFKALIEHAYGIFKDSPSWPSLLTVLEALLRQQPAAIRRTLTTDRMSCWIWRGMEALEFTYLPRFDALARHLPTLLLEQASGALIEGQRFTVARSGPRQLRFHESGFEVVADAELPSNISARAGPGQTLSLDLGESVTVDLAKLEPDPIGQGLSIEKTPSVGAMRVISEDAWLTGFFAGGPRFGGRRVDETADVTHLIDSLRGAYELIDSTWPEARRELDLMVSTVVPLLPASSAPHHHSISPVRGTVMLEAREPQTLLRGLIFELGRTKARNLSDAFEMFEEDTRTTSPLDGSDVSLARLFADVLGRIYERELCKRSSMPVGPDDALDQARAKLAPFIEI